MTSKDEPALKEAMGSHRASKWKETIFLEPKALEQKGTFDIVDRPKNEPVLHSKLVLKLKRAVGRAVDKFKTR